MLADVHERRPPAWRELAMGLALFALYTVVNALDWDGKEQTARRHGEQILRLQERLHLDWERPLNEWLAPHDVLRVIANYEYALTYVLSAFGLLLYLWLRRPDVYRSARRSFALLNLLGITGFLFYPLMPPRLLPGAGFVDTVADGSTWGSWGSPLVGHANQLAAMPSLHFAWALWVSAVLARIAHGWKVQLVSAVHVVITLFVILATANHYLVDALVAVLLVAVSATVAGREHVGTTVPGADAFFLHVESDRAPQHVGGVVLLDTSSGVPSWQDVEDLVRRQLADVPRFRQLLLPGSRWERAAWVEAPEVDWTWHVSLHDAAGGGLPAFHALVARVQEELLPRDRPLWRMHVVHDIAPDRAGVVFVVHHVIADGIGTVAQALRLLEPPVVLGADVVHKEPNALVRGLATTAGLAQLATDGWPPSKLPSGHDARRTFGAARLPLDLARATAKARGARLSDVLLSSVAGGLRIALIESGHTPPDTVRVSVPLMVRDPRDTSVGNVTGAVMVDVPLGGMPEPERLAAIAKRTSRLRSPTRALAARFVMQAAGELLPPVLHAAFARAFYGPRTFSAIVSNMPGPAEQLSLAGARIDAAFPLLPLAPDVPLAIGVLGWHGELCLGISADPALVPDADALGAAVSGAFDALSSPSADRPRPSLR
jgi:hypothetical protein